MSDCISAHIRWMIRRDLGDVLAIEKQSFTHPWTEDDFITSLRQRNCIAMVAEIDEAITGFTVYELFKNKIHILDFAVAENFRRGGVGSQMVLKLVAKLSQQIRDRISVEVRESNFEAQLFFKSQGFRAVSVLRDRYSDSNEDGYLMEREFQSKPVRSVKRF